MQHLCLLSSCCGDSALTSKSDLERSNMMREHMVLFAVAIGVSANCFMHSVRKADRLYYPRRQNMVETPNDQ